MNTDIISDEESDDFTDEEEEQQQQQQQQVATPTVTRRPSICDNELYNSTKAESNIGSSQWYIDIPKTDHFESSNGNLSS
jgi:hypothetical protein